MHNQPPGTFEYEKAAECWEHAATCRHRAHGLYSTGRGQAQKVSQAVAWQLGAEAWERAGKLALDKSDD